MLMGKLSKTNIRIHMFKNICFERCDARKGGWDGGEQGVGEAEMGEQQGAIS